jgi:CRISPR-associated protein Cas5h
MEPVAKPIVIFRYFGRFAHFLRAEASASALSYPLPSRTVLLGVIGAVLGIAKDAPQLDLKEALIAVNGELPSTHWHYATFRQTLSPTLPTIIQTGAKGNSTDNDMPKRIRQEWLLQPSYQVIASLPEPYHSQFVERLKNKAWHYQPCMGLAEMRADLELTGLGEAKPLEGEQTIPCQSVVPQTAATVDGSQMLEEKLEIQVIRMPRAVTSDRVFSHANYLVERQGKAIPVRTSQAWEIQGDQVMQVMFL